MTFFKTIENTDSTLSFPAQSTLRDNKHRGSLPTLTSRPSKQLRVLTTGRNTFVNVTSSNQKRDFSRGKSANILNRDLQ